MVTWVFDDGFVPAAKITEEGSYSIVSDYMGTPVEAYDRHGKRVWAQELDIYGRVKKSNKPSWERKAEDALFDEFFIPFRYQGQYADLETDLYYNRFRYYDPEIGQYTQPDPIGLEGGNPTLYAYVRDTNIRVDPFGLRDFIVTPRGVAVHANQADLQNSILNADGIRVGPTTQTTETGQIFRINTQHGQVEVRIMEGREGGGANQGPRTITTRPGTNEYVHPNGASV